MRIVIDLLGKPEKERLCELEVQLKALPKREMPDPRIDIEAAFEVFMFEELRITILKGIQKRLRELRR